MVHLVAKNLLVWYRLLFLINFSQIEALRGCLNAQDVRRYLCGELGWEGDIAVVSLLVVVRAAIDEGFALLSFHLVEVLNMAVQPTFLG